MKTSFCSNSCAARQGAQRPLRHLTTGTPPGRPHGRDRHDRIARQVFAASLLLALVPACQTDPAVDPCAGDDVPTVDGIADSAVRVSQLTLEARESFAADGQRTTSQAVRLTVSDRTLGSMQSREPTPCCGAEETCFVLTGRPTPRCREPSADACGSGPACPLGKTCVQEACVDCVSTALRVRSASLEGLTDTAIALEPLGTGGDKWTVAGLEPPLFDPARALSLKVEGDTADGFFPSYVQTLEAPAPIELLEPDPRAPPALRNHIDLRVTWKPGNGHWVEAHLRPQASDSNADDSVVCFSRDDGCLQLPAGAFDLMTEGLPADGAVQLSLRRVMSQTMTLGAQETGAQETGAQQEPSVAQIKAIERVDVLLSR